MKTWIEGKNEQKNSCRRLRAHFGVGLLSILMFGLMLSPLNAQNSSGAIVGTVTDGTGAVVSGAAVTITNLATNEKRSAQSAANGDFHFADLLPSSYKVEVVAKTFKAFVVASAAVQVDNTLRVDAVMQAGAASETVIVTTTPPLLQTESGTLGSEIEGRQVQEMPLNGRNPMNLIALAPGVVPQGASQGSAGENQFSHTSNAGWGNYQIGGGMGGESAEFLDSGPLNTLGGNNVALVPTQDSIQEFRVETNAVSPQYGRFAGGVVALATKSGANAFHGSAYEYFRNKVLNANNFFNNLAGIPRPEWNQDQFGTTFSGPVRRNKAFFFFNWEGFRSLLGVPNPTNVPTANMQQGIFTTPITDPTGRCAIVHNAAAGTWTVPQSCWDPTAAVLKNLFPLPVTPNNPGSNYYVAPLTGSNSNQWDGRVDYDLSPKQRLFGRYTYWRLADISPSEFNDANGYKTGNGYSKTAAQQAVLGDTYTINQNTIADLRVSYLRSYFDVLAPSLGVDESQFGAAYAALAPSMSFRTLPEPGLSGPDGLYGFFPTDNVSVDKWNTYSIIGDVIRNAGHHSLKFGGEARLEERSGLGNLLNPSGRFNFSNQTTGDEFASFLLGEFQNAAITTVQATDTFNYSGGIYALDAWQVSRSLTLNLGVRYELPGGLEENHDRGTELLPNAVDPYTGVKGTLALLNSSLYPSRSFEPIRYNLFSPRVGFAQRFGEDTVLRGGYGLVYLPPDLPTGVMAFNSTVNNAVTTSLNGPVPNIFLSNPFPTGILQPVGRSNPAFMQSRLGQVLSGPEPNQPYPYMQQWNLTWAQQFTSNLVWQFGYAASKGTHLPDLEATGIDELSSQYYSLGSQLLQPSASDPSISLGQSLRPYPQYQNLSNSSGYSGSSTYNSLQTQAQMQFHSGGVLTANYTWAKLLTDTDTLNSGVEQAGISGPEGVYQDFNNLKAERSLASFDVRQRAIINYVVDLPFGKGRRFGGNLTGVADKVASGWGLNGITSFQTGFPLALSYNGGNILTQQFGAGTLRPNYSPGCLKQGSGSAYERVISGNWFNAACFTTPGSYAFGDEPRVDPTLRAQGIDNYDFSLLKTTPIRDAVSVQFRMEFFNIFNHPQFSNPGVAENGGNFDQVTTQLNKPRLIQASLRINF